MTIEDTPSASAVSPLQSDSQKVRRSDSHPPADHSKLAAQSMRGATQGRPVVYTHVYSEKPTLVKPTHTHTHTHSVKPTHTHTHTHIL
eukprot:5318860-Pyramimonas_sp.AAC.1